MSNSIIISIIDDKTILQNTSKEYYIQSKDGEIHSLNKEASEKANKSIYDYVFKEGDNLVEKVKTVELTSYKAKENTPPQIKKEITVETFEKLPKNLKTLYTAIHEKVEELEIANINYELFNLNNYALQYSEFKSLTFNEGLNELEKLNFKTVNKRAMISIKHKSTYSEGYIKVKFFKNDYNGETTKRLDKKSNGQPYADRRGRIVPVYPEVVSEIEIPESFIPTFQSNSFEELQDEIEKYFHHITQTIELNVK